MTGAFIAKWAVVFLVSLAALGSVLNLTAQPDRVCKADAERAKVNGQTLAAYAAGRIAERDAGKLAIGLRRWRLVA